VNQQRQPELPIDPPDTETPVDHLEVAQTLLRDVEHELDQADITAITNALLQLTLETLQNQIEMLQ
jgi:hypothetical protein